MTAEKARETLGSPTSLIRARFSCFVASFPDPEFSLSAAEQGSPVRDLRAGSCGLPSVVTGADEGHFDHSELVSGQGLASLLRYAWVRANIIRLNVLHRSGRASRHTHLLALEEEQRCLLLVCLDLCRVAMVRRIGISRQCSSLKHYLYRQGRLLALPPGQAMTFFGTTGPAVSGRDSCAEAGRFHISRPEGIQGHCIPSHG